MKNNEENNLSDVVLSGIVEGKSCRGKNCGVYAVGNITNKLYPEAEDLQIRSNCRKRV